MSTLSTAKLLFDAELSLNFARPKSEPIFLKVLRSLLITLTK